jgi:GR25 family glycosyltransferase involved in LPS biosynthesis
VNLKEKTLRGVIGCALSHLQIWDIVKNGDEPFAIIFEDDARLLSTRPSSLIKALREIPVDADLIWLSNYRRPALGRFKRGLNHALLLQPKVKFSFVRWAAVTEVTTEAYVISRAFAKVASDFLRDDIGAVDEVLRARVANYQANAFLLEPPLFRQADRSSSDIQT